MAKMQMLVFLKEAPANESGFKAVVGVKYAYPDVKQATGRTYEVSSPILNEYAFTLGFHNVGAAKIVYKAFQFMDRHSNVFKDGIMQAPIDFEKFIK